jgi:hypothetical protein
MTGFPSRLYSTPLCVYTNFLYPFMDT